MKARKNPLENFKVERIRIPERYQERPHDYDSYIWETQDGRFVRLPEFDDWHLRNTYNMLVNTIMYAREMNKHKALTNQMRRIVTLCNYHLTYIAYELWIREYPKYQNKYEMKTDKLAKNE